MTIQDEPRPSAAEPLEPSKTAAARRQEARSREPRDRLFGNEFATAEELAGAFAWSIRTLIRREAEGMPGITIEQTKLYRIAAVREWLIGHERGGPPPSPTPRRRGRPSRPRPEPESHD